MYNKYAILILFVFGTINSFGQEDSDDMLEENKNAPMTKYKANKIGVIQVKDNIFMLKGRGGNIGVSVGDEGVFVIDSQFPDASADIVQRIRSLSKKPIKLLINTHHHGDHVGGNRNLTNEGALVFSHEMARRRMTAPYMKAAQDKHQRSIDSIIERQGAKITTVEDKKAATRDAEKIVGSVEDIMNLPQGTFPVVSFSKDLTFNFNGEKILAIHIPKAHTDGDVLLYFTESNVMHTGDAFVNKTYPYIDIENNGSLKGYMKGLQEILRLINDETIIIPGHGPIASKDDVSYTYNMLRFLNDRIAFHVVSQKTEQQVVSMTEITKEYDDQGFGEGFITTENLVRTLYKEVSKKYKK